MADIVAAAKGKPGAVAPHRLVFAQWCSNYRALPGAGGLYDQDYREIYLNEVLPQIYDAVSHWRRKNGIGLSEGDQKIINWLAKTGAM